MTLRTSEEVGEKLVEFIPSCVLVEEVRTRGLEDHFEHETIRDISDEKIDLVLDYAGRLRSAAYAKNWHDCMDLAERLEAEAHKWSR